MRSRYLATTATGLLALCLLAWASGEWLSGRPNLGGMSARAPVAVVAPLAAAVLISVTLAGPDADLERASARMHRRWYTSHALAVGLLPAVALAMTALTAPDVWGGCALLRNTAGMVGAVLLSATVLPAAVAWGPTFAYASVVYMTAPRIPTASSTVWAWPMQPGGPDLSWACAAALLIAGVVRYGRRGPKASVGVG